MTNQKVNNSPIVSFLHSTRSHAFVHRASYCEIYNEGLHDLINYTNRAQLPVRWDAEHGFHVPDLVRHPVPTLKDMYKVCTSSHLPPAHIFCKIELLHVFNEVNRSDQANAVVVVVVVGFVTNRGK